MIKTLLKSLREYKKSSILTPFFVTLEVIVECFIPFITARLITAIQRAESISDIWRYGLILICLSVAALTFGALSGYYCAVAASGFAKNLRYDMFGAVQKFSFSNIDRFSSASIITRITTDVSYVQMAYMMAIRIAVRGPLMIVFALIMAVAISPSLSLVFAFILPFLAIGLALIIYRAMPLFRSVFKKLDKLNESIQENVSGMRVVKAYVREDYEKEKFKKASDDVARDFSRAEKIVALNNPLMSLSIHVVVLVISYFGSKMIVTSGATLLQIGDFTALITYGVQILMSLMMLSMVIVMIMISYASAGRIAEILKAQPDIANPENAVRGVSDGSLSFEGVSFRYSEKADRMALEGVDFSLRSGETLGIIGGTGTGKSSLVQLIPRLYDTSEGSVKVGGRDVREYDLETLRNNVAFVLQKNVLFSGTIKENLRWGNEFASDEDLVRVCKIACAHEFIESFPDKYDHAVEQGGTNLSGGQRQRLCIARALLKDPKILILDDSTSAVDTKTDMLIRTALKEKIPQVTKIIIAQRITSVSHADKIIVMESGRIHGVGTHEELLAENEIYREVYESQIKGSNSNE